MWKWIQNWIMDCRMAWFNEHTRNTNTIATKRIKYLGKQLIKKIKDLYNEYYKTLKKKWKTLKMKKIIDDHGL